MSHQDSMSETVQRPVDRPAEERPLQARLIVVHPASVTTTIELGDAVVVFGRKPDPGGVRLADPTVSRKHFSIQWDTALGQHTGRDLGSRNGSRVSGIKASDTHIPLVDGSVVRIGDVVGVYECGFHLDASDPAEVSREAVPGQATATRQLRRMIGRSGPDPSPAMLIGETGTGKEFIAREIHRLSGRSGPFLAINCAALSPQLIESQLFGHAKGAFTGAQQAHEGLFRAADGGTLFLDEIGELPLDLQPKLLRVLQEKEVNPVGETTPIRVDVRIVAATLRDLTEQTKTGKFRLDLYARLSLWEVRVPALRERRSDLLDWMARLHRRWHAERGSEAELPCFDADAVEKLLLHEWSDNLRGLDRIVHRICTEAAGATIDSAQLDGWLTPGTQRATTARAATPATTTRTRKKRARPPKPSQDELMEVLEEHGGSVRATAKHYGRDRRQIYRWMEQYGLREKAGASDGGLDDSLDGDEPAED